MLPNIHLERKQTAHHHPQGLGLLEQELRASGPALRILKVGSSLASRRSQPAEQRGKASSGTRKTAKRNTNRGDSSKRATEGDQNLWGAHRVDQGGCSAQTALRLAQCTWILVQFLRGTLICPRPSRTHEIKTNKRFEGATAVILLKLDLKLPLPLFDNLCRDCAMFHFLKAY